MGVAIRALATCMLINIMNIQANIYFSVVKTKSIGSLYVQNYLAARPKKILEWLLMRDSQLIPTRTHKALRFNNGNMLLTVQLFVSSTNKERRKAMRARLTCCCNTRDEYILDEDSTLNHPYAEVL